MDRLLTQWQFATPESDGAERLGNKCTGAGNLCGALSVSFCDHVTKPTAAAVTPQSR
ncbi:MAG: hypothetical protein J6386_23965 [Candidatus Synoicihabitans palmerolidicus]|nr:hypothetical protein [Candidatus Synoicihabitans palmerolidicus]